LGVVKQGLTVKVTIEITDELLGEAKTAAAARGETLREFITKALTTRLASTSTPIAAGSGWRSVFGLADPKAVQRVDAVIESEFEQIEPSDWR
jgi:Arc/MetJ family transcription regulator